MVSQQNERARVLRPLFSRQLPESRDCSSDQLLAGGFACFELDYTSPACFSATEAEFSAPARRQHASETACAATFHKVECSKFERLTKWRGHICLMLKRSLGHKDEDTLAQDSLSSSVWLSCAVLKSFAKLGQPGGLCYLHLQIVLGCLFLCLQRALSVSKEGLKVKLTNGMPTLSLTPISIAALFKDTAGSTTTNQETLAGSLPQQAEPKQRHSPIVLLPL